MCVVYVCCMCVCMCVVYMWYVCMCVVMCMCVVYMCALCMCCVYVCRVVCMCYVVYMWCVNVCVVCMCMLSVLCVYTWCVCVVLCICVVCVECMCCVLCVLWVMCILCVLWCAVCYAVQGDSRDSSPPLPSQQGKWLGGQGGAVESRPPAGTLHPLEQKKEGVPSPVCSGMGALPMLLPQDSYPGSTMGLGRGVPFFICRWRRLRHLPQGITEKRGVRTARCTAGAGHSSENTALVSFSSSESLGAP